MLNCNYTMYIIIKASYIFFTYISEKEEIHSNELKCRHHFSRRFLNMVSSRQSFTSCQMIVAIAEKLLYYYLLLMFL